MPTRAAGDDERRIAVLIADDSDVLVETLVAALGRHPLLEVVGTAPDGQAALDAVDATAPDVVVMDLRLGEAWGLDLVPALRARPRPPGIVVFSATSDPAVVEAAADAGVAALVAKGAPLDELVAAIVAAAPTGASDQS